MSGVILGSAFALAGAYVSNRSADKQASAQRDAMRQQEQLAKQEQEKARQAERRQNQNTADVSGILDQNKNAMLSGGSTLLTGAGGVDQSELNLGKGNKLG